MEARLNLVENEAGKIEKRILPRFPFTYLTFKCEGKGPDHAFQVRDISYNGMKVALKTGGHPFEMNDAIKGNLTWKGRQLKVDGKIIWCGAKDLGVEFVLNKDFDNSVRDFLSLDHLIQGIRPIHDLGLEMELPSDLKYWLRSEGPVEIFVWQHKDGELSRFQLVVMDHFVEWQDGQGLRTGTIIETRDHDTPLKSEDEFICHMDRVIDEDKVILAQKIIKLLPFGPLPNNTSDFLKMKLGG